ncbi:MAG: hypothetical protein EBT68_07680 [Verrucomicrobia bacterium]|nr:hypothetical protein [Verrucomicrobiota bacterium]
MHQGILCPHLLPRPRRDAGLRGPYGRAHPHPLGKLRAFQGRPLGRSRSRPRHRLPCPTSDFPPGNLPHPPHVTVADSLQPSPPENSIRHLALGFFDGLHLGHRRVILGGDSPHDPSRTAVLTFRDHPLSVLHPEKHPALITGLPHKLRILETWGIQRVVTLPFNATRALQAPEDFLGELESAFPSLKTVSVGPNWRFGKNRSGDVRLLGQWCAGRQILLDNPAPVLFTGERISSSRIRSAIAAGRLDDTAAMLGRPFSLFGTVVPGDGRGTQLGFPTANLSTSDECLPPVGVYAGKALLENNTNHPCVETHLIGFSGNLVGNSMEIQILRWIRNETKFENMQSLADQIFKDIHSI